MTLVNDNRTADSGQTPDAAYLDFAATSWPKHPDVAEAMTDALRSELGSPDRGAHRWSVRAATVVRRLRLALSRLVGLPDDGALALLASCTDASNAVIGSVARRARERDGPDAVVLSTFEHNAVARPVFAYAACGDLSVRVVAPRSEPNGRPGLRIEPEDVAAACDERTALVCVTHASNVTGALQPVSMVVRAVRRRAPRAIVLVDAAQTVGAAPVVMNEIGADAVIFGSHKHLLGPQGVGALAVSSRLIDASSPPGIAPTRFGGTGGSNAAASAIDGPSRLPGSLEVGTPNVVAMAGLLAAVAQLDDAELAARRTHEARLVTLLLERLRTTPGVTVYGVDDPTQRVGVVSLAIDGLDANDAAMALDASFGVAVRSGLHCAPLTHEHLGTSPAGLVRLSVGPTTTADQIERAVSGVRAMTAASVNPSPSAAV